METLRSDKRKARKDHRCDWCYGVIPKGEVYRNSCHVHGGDIYTFKNHLSCEKWVKERGLFEGRWGDGVSDYVFQEDVMVYCQDHMSKEEFTESSFQEKLQWGKQRLGING